jgi:hypothetical protein
MTDRTMSLLDVLAPPGNDWLRELCRRKSDLPAGVRIVRFSEADDDLGEVTAGTTGRRKHATA